MKCGKGNINKEIQISEKQETSNEWLWVQLSSAPNSAIQMLSNLIVDKGVGHGFLPVLKTADIFLCISLD